MTAPNAAYHYLLGKLADHQGHIVNTKNESITVEMVTNYFASYTPSPTLDGGAVLGLTRR